MAKRVSLTITEHMDDGTSRTTRVKASVAEQKMKPVLRDLDRIWKEHDKMSTSTDAIWESFDHTFSLMNRLFDRVFGQKNIGV